MVIKYGGLVIAGSFFVQILAPGCPGHDKICEKLGEPVHTHQEAPTGGDRITVTSLMAGSGSNVSAGISYVRLGANIIDGPARRPRVDDHQS